MAHHKCQSFFSYGRIIKIFLHYLVMRVNLLFLYSCKLSCMQNTFSLFRLTLHINNKLLNKVETMQTNFVKYLFTDNKSI